MTAFKSVSCYDKKPHTVLEFRLISNRTLVVGGRVDVLKTIIEIKLELLKLRVLDNVIQQLKIGPTNGI